MCVGVDPALTVRDAIGLAYHSYIQAKPRLQRLRDRELRHPEWTRRLLDAFGSIDADMFNVAVTGSKGKGSHAILLAGMLQKLGLRVGLFTGPHLVDFMERIRINGHTIPESEFVTCMQMVHRRALTWELPEGQYFGPVGLLAVVACLWFQRMETDVNIFECGRGALHDDVNQVRHVGAVLSPVFMEHAWELGPTIQDIAREKAGVVTDEVQWVTCHTQSEDVRAVLSEVWNPKRHLDVREFGPDYNAVWSENDGLCMVTVQESFERVARIVLPERLSTFADNAAVAWDAASQVYERVRAGCTMPAEIDLSNIRLPGRLDIIRDRPLTVVDGTIHGTSAVRVARWLENQLQQQRVKRAVAILSMPDDKDGLGVVRAISPFVETVIVTRAHNPHLVFGDRLAREAEAYIADVRISRYIEDAATMAETLISSEDCLLLLGTQSFVGDALRFYEADSTSIWQRPIDFQM